MIEIKNIDRQTKIGLAAVVIAAILILGFLLVSKNKTDSLGSNENVSNEAIRVLPAGSKQELEEELKKIIDQEKDLSQDAESRYDFYLHRASINYQLGKNKDAFAALEKIVNDTESYANPSRVWFLYANIYNESNDLDRALASIQKAVAADGTREDYWLTYVGLTQQKDSNQDLNNLYSEALTKTNNAIELVRAYARYLEHLGQKDRAVELWRKAIEVDPDAKAEYEAQIKRIQTS